MKLIAIVLAVVCNTIEPLHEYNDRKIVEKKWGVSRTDMFPIGRPCEWLPKTTPVEVIERNSDYPFILKLRYSEPDKLVYDAAGQIVGKGVVSEVYGHADDFAAKLPPTVVPQPSAKTLEARKRTEELKRTWGLPGTVIVIDGE